MPPPATASRLAASRWLPTADGLRRGPPAPKMFTRSMPRVSGIRLTSGRSSKTPRTPSPAYLHKRKRPAANRWRLATFHFNRPRGARSPAAGRVMPGPESTNRGRRAGLRNRSWRAINLNHRCEAGCACHAPNSRTSAKFLLRLACSWSAPPRREQLRLFVGIPGHQWLKMEHRYEGDAQSCSDLELARDPRALPCAAAEKPMIRRIRGIITRDVTKSVIGTIFLKVAGGGVAFAMFSLAARNMLSDSFGHLAMWLSIAQIGCVIGLFGQEMLVVRSLNEYSVANQPGHTKGILLFSNGVGLSLSILACLVVVAFAWFARHDSPALVLAVALFMIANAAIMLGSQIARSLVSIVMGEGSRDLLWRLLVVIALLIALATR